MVLIVCMKRLHLYFLVISKDTLSLLPFFSLLIFTILIITEGLYTEVPNTLAGTTTIATTQAFTKLLLWWITEFL